MDEREKQKLVANIAIIAGLFTAIVSIIMMLNFWQLQKSDPMDSELLKTLVERLNEDKNNEELREDIRQLDLMNRKAYFTKQWQIRAGAYIIIAGAVILVIALRLYYSLTAKVEEPDTADRNVIQELLSSQRWILYTSAAVFGLSLTAAILSNDHLSKTYGITETSPDKDDAIEEINVRTKTEDAAKAVRTQVSEQAKTPFTVTEYVLRRFLGIVGHFNHIDAQGTDLQLFATGQQTCGLNRFAHPAQGAATQVHRKIVAPRQQTHAMHVVGMFVGHQNRAQLRGVNPQAQQAPLGFPQGETTIHQDVRVVMGYKRAVPLATAAENGKTHRISPGCPESRPTLCAPLLPAPRC